MKGENISKHLKITQTQTTTNMSFYQLLRNYLTNNLKIV